MRRSEPQEVSLQSAQALVGCLPHPRVTEDSIKDLIREVKYFLDETTTICIITMANGFRVIGHSTPAHAGNFVESVGQRYAFENAFKQLWQLEGYVLRERLAQKGQ